MDLRIGFGYDVHQLSKGYDLWLGGVKIPHEKGSVGHSDADVLIHAICDALLGAANLSDIGYHFPDTEPAYKGIDSKKLLSEVMQMIRKDGFDIGNLDTTVCVEKPRINPHIDSMKDRLSEVMKINKNKISIKATTSEKMGFVGKEEGIEAYAVALIHKKS